MSTKAPGQRKAMHAGDPIPGNCNAKNRNGTLCKRTAGWGTGHVGAGRCSYHSGSTPNGIKAAAKEAIGNELARLGGTGWHIAVDVDPLDGLLQVIQGAAGQVAHANALLEREARRRGEAEEAGPPSFALLMLKEAQGELARYCKMALDAGVADRKVRLAERMGALIAAAAERAMAKHPERHPPKDRAEFARDFMAELAALERQDADTLEG